MMKQTMLAAGGIAALILATSSAMSLKPVSNRVPGPFGAAENPTAPYLTIVIP